MNADDPEAELWHDPAYRMMIAEVAVNRFAFVHYLIERGDLEAAEAELDLAIADRESTPDAWEAREIQALKERGLNEEDLRAIFKEAEQRRAEWLGMDR